MIARTCDCCGDSIPNGKVAFTLTITRCRVRNADDFTDPKKSYLEANKVPWMKWREVCESCGWAISKAFNQVKDSIAGAIAEGCEDESKS